MGVQKHGMCDTGIYNVWRNIHQKCLNPNNPSYKYYGGRGISFCQEWHDFMVFYKWAIESGYRPGLTIDRINNDGDYTPDNCRWVTMKVQSLNKRNIMMVEYNGKRQSLKEWSRELGFSRGVLESRIKIYGWPIDEALSTPSNKHNKRHRR